MPDTRKPARISEREPFIYLEHAHISTERSTVTVSTNEDRTSLPAAQIAAVLIGPGCTVTAAATRELAYRQVTVVHVGERAVRYIATGKPWSANGHLAERHALAWANSSDAICARLYELRWGQPPRTQTANAIRGEEGAATRKLYAAAAKANKVPWDGRRRTQNSTDNANRALSWAGACVNSVAAAAVHAAGALAALGFLHRGGSFSFVYDIADLARNEVIALTFEHLGTDPDISERLVRHACRDHFRTEHIGEQLIEHVVHLFEAN